MSSREPERVTLGVLLRAARDRLQSAGIEDAALEAELLMRQALRRQGGGLPTKAWLLPRLGQDANDAVRTAFDSLVARRLEHEPSAYITGTREFCALDFEVTPEVLIPRPETELLVEAAISALEGGSKPHPRPLSLRGEGSKTFQARIADVGTGSGAIAVALTKELPTATVIATDVSWGALAVARRNAARHGVERRISFRHGDLLLPVDCYVDLIVANLPYVREDDWRSLQPEVRDHEPSLALVGGADGLDLIRALLHQAPRYLRASGAICLEFGIGQEQSLLAAVHARLPAAEVQIFEDFAGIPRVLMASLQRK